MAELEEILMIGGPIILEELLDNEKTEGHGGMSCRPITRKKCSNANLEITRQIRKTGKSSTCCSKKKTRIR